MKKNLVSSCFCLLAIFSVVLANAMPMQPAKSTLFILLDGMNPSNKGLLEGYCQHYEDSDTWGKTGAAKFFQEDITNNHFNVFSRSYRNPAEAPSEMKEELAGHGLAKETMNCVDEMLVYEPSTYKFTRKQSGNVKVSSIIDDALEYWFANVLEEVKMPLINNSRAQIIRNTWEGSEGSYTPKKQYSAYGTDVNPYLYAWVNNFKDVKHQYPTLADLKKERPDFLPSRYVFVANGMGGMVAREYVQDLEYQGDVDKILFLDTPHEGTGFADHALKSQDPAFYSRNTELTSIYGLAIPVIMGIYLYTNEDKIDEHLIEVTKLFMAALQGVKGYGLNDAFNKKFFDGYSIEDGALWYMAHDADVNDKDYDAIRLEASEDNPNIEKLIGGAQLLNQYGMTTQYDDPMYRLFYSYGMPTVGNGRRAKADFPFQKKNHFDEEQLNEVLRKMAVEQLKSSLKDSLIKFAFENTGVTDWTEEKIDYALDEIVDYFFKGARHWQTMTEFEGSESSEVYESLARSLGGLETNPAAKAIVEMSLDAAMSTAIEAVGNFAVGLLSKYIDVAAMMDDIPDEIVSVLTVLADAVPQQLQSKIVSSFIPYYSPRYEGMKLAKNDCGIGGLLIDNITSPGDIQWRENCTAAGQSELAKTFLNYSIDFFDQGSYMSPTYSSYGGSVGLFAGKDVSRKAYPLHTIDDGDSRYKDFRDNLVAEGLLEGNRKTLDKILGTVCKALKSTAYGPVCRAAEFAANGLVMMGMLMETNELIDDYDVVAQTGNMALKASLKNSQTKEFTLRSGYTRKVAYSDMAEMLYEKPYISLPMIRTASEETEYVPMLLTAVSKSDDINIPEIVNIDQLKAVYPSVKYNGAATFIKQDQLRLKKFNTPEDYRPVTLRRDVYEKNPANDHVKHVIEKYAMTPIVVKDFIREYRFQIDDLRPDLLWEIAVDFNTDVQIIYERKSNDSWTVVLDGSGNHQKIDVTAAAGVPVDDMGLFVVRPELLIEYANKMIDTPNSKYASSEKYTLSKAQVEGSNLVTITATNFLGLTTSQQFTYYFQATLPKLSEGWPVYLQSVSSLDEVYISASNQGDPYEFTEGELCLVREDNGKFVQVLDKCVEVTPEVLKNDKVGEVWGQMWNFKADLGENFLKNNNIPDGEYILQWKLTTEDRRHNKSSYNMNVRILIDTTDPVISFNLPTTNLTNSAKDGTWGKILNANKESLRATRIYVVSDSDNKTYFLKQVDGTGASEINFNWVTQAGELPSGSATVYAQSVDFAEPNAAMGALLQKLYSDVPSERDAAWEKILDSDGEKFVPGVNGKTIKQSIFIDNLAPNVNVNAVNLVAVKGYGPECADCPVRKQDQSEGTKANQNQETVVNSSELLKVSFNLADENAKEPSNLVRVQVILVDVSQSLVKSYVASHDFKKTPTFEFEESSLALFPDGEYVVSLVLVDEAGNSSGNLELPKKVRIDRTAPVVNNVVTNEPVYADASDVNGAAFTVSSSDLPVNLSGFTCYQKISNGAYESEWIEIAKISAEQLSSLGKVSASYSIKNSGANIGKGRYAAYVGCYDEAGNFGVNSDPFSVGFRTPELSYPTSKLGSKISDDKIQILGIAPNPIVPGGNAEDCQYKVEWRKVGDPNWSSAGITSTDKIVSTVVNSLAVWDRTNLDAGDYELRLSVRGCSVEGDANCAWVEGKAEKISLDDISDKPKPTITINLPQKTMVPGEGEEVISSVMNGVVDGSNWSMDMKVYVSDPFDPKNTIVAKEAYLDSMIIAPFANIPTETLPNGLSIWQEKDEWIVKYVGEASAAENFTMPALVMKYNHSALTFVSKPKVATESFFGKDEYSFSQELNMNDFVIPAFNYSSEWDLSEFNGTGFEMRFKTSEPFILEMISIKDIFDNLYCGKNLCNQYFGYMAPGVVSLYVHPDSFKMEFAWDGLTPTKLYPSSTKAKVVAVAAEKWPGTRVVTEERDLLLGQAPMKIVSDYNGKGQLVISPEDENSKVKVVRLGHVGMDFGIQGKNASVTVDVVDPNGKVIASPMKNQPCVAGTSLNSYSVLWDGVTEYDLANTVAGQYNFVITAVDGDGEKKTSSYPFSVVLAGQLIPAPDDGSANAAYLEMDEAVLDDNNNMRFVGKPDYLVTADMSARSLSENDREFDYYWDWTGVQYPAFYRANRFSLGVHRRRKSFPVTIVTLLSTYGYDMEMKCEGLFCSEKFGYYPKDKRYAFNIVVNRVTFDEIDNNGTFEIPDLGLDADEDIILGYDNQGDHYQVMVYTKVFADAKGLIAKSNTQSHKFNVSDDKFSSWSMLKPKENADFDNKYLNDFRNDYIEDGGVLLWSNKRVFKSNEGETHIDDSKDPGVNTVGCTPNEENNYECDDNVAGFDPHKNMLQVAIEHVNNHKKFYNDHYSCGCSNGGSSTNVFAKITYKVNKSYWKSEFGYSNLANKYVRFDHTNKTLYDENTYFPICEDAKNYYDGMKWTHSDYYGMVTPFEVQRFAYEEHCASNNPLQFADETNPTTPSRYEFQFLDVDNDEKYDATKYGEKQGFVAVAVGKTDASNEKLTEVLFSNENDLRNLGKSKNNAWLKPQVDFFVTVTSPALTMGDEAIGKLLRQHSSESVKYPLADGKYSPVKFGNDRLCDLTSEMRNIDDQEYHCFWYYPAASRIHYGLGDWTDDEWKDYFISSQDHKTFKNPIYVNTEDPMSVSGLVGDLYATWGSTVPEAAYEKASALSDNYDNNTWYMTERDLNPIDNSDTKIGKMPPNVNKSLVLSEISRQNGWDLCGAEDVSKGRVACNGGTEFKNIKMNYVRGSDSKKIDYAKLQPGKSETIDKSRLAEQNNYKFMSDNLWTHEFALKNAKIVNRKTGDAHEYFDVAVSKSGEDIVVTRNGKTPDTRLDEMVTLRGLVPKNVSHWSLSYLSKGKMVTIADGDKQPQSEDGLYPKLAERNVNTLQGNTSFFLTYGLNDAAGDVYFKQLDVHVGEFLKANEQNTIQSMYGNASVYFPKGSFDRDVDVTVRVADLEDFHYSVFNGLDPVGTIVEVLPSHKFGANDATWPRVSVVITKETLGQQNPLDVRIYKPDFDNAKIVPLEEQELAFYKGTEVLQHCDANTVCDKVPEGWTEIKVSGKTPTFSAFLVMDKEKAALVKEAEKENSNIPEFACDVSSMPVDKTLWMGLVNGYLDYTYPCTGESNYLLQLRKDGNAVAEHQGVATSDIKWEARANDVQSRVTFNDVLESRLALYGSNGKNVQTVGPDVRVDATLPVLNDASIDVEDYDLQKRVVVKAEFEDSESGIQDVKMEFHWAGMVVETRDVLENEFIEEEFLLTKSMANKCVGCNVEVVLTAYDRGHNFVKKTLVSEDIYPFPKSMVLWYPLMDGAGTVAKEAMGTGVDLALKLKNPWLYGASLYFSNTADVAKPSSKWEGVGTVPMSLEFRMISKVARAGSDFSIVSWDATNDWILGLKDASSLFFKYKGETLLFTRANVKTNVNAHYVLTVSGKTVSLYRDGNLVEQKNLSSSFNWNTNGRPVFGTYGKFSSVAARVSGVRFYQSALTSDEVMDLYRGDVDVADAKIEVVRAVDITERDGLTVDQTCDLAGLAYLRNKKNVQYGNVTWKVATDLGRYNIYALARGFAGQTSGVDVFVDGASVGRINVPETGSWMPVMLDGAGVGLSSGEHEITFKPIGYTGLASFAIANAESAMPAEMISWNEGEWTTPDPKVSVEMTYPAYNDKTWLRANFRIKNISDETLENVKLRYYYSGEDNFVATRAFYPDVAMSVVADAGNVFYMELPLVENIPAGSSPYYNNGPQIGAYRTDDYAQWTFEDDPSFDKQAVDGNFHVTDKIAVLDGEGNLLSKFSCYDVSGPAAIKTPNVRVVAKEENSSSTNASTVVMKVENVGSIPVQGFEVRYYVRDTETPVFDSYSNMFAEASLVHSAGDLYYVSYRYKNVILNPGESSDYGDGVKFAVHHENWQNWDASDDPSHDGLTQEFAATESIVILDLNGNILWGNIPQPSNVVVEINGNGSYGNMITIDSDGILVDVPADGDYILERVNAAGISVGKIYNGSWSAGEHYISIEDVQLVSGEYLVLRRGTTILSRVKIK